MVSYQQEKPAYFLVAWLCDEEGGQLCPQPSGQLKAHGCNSYVVLDAAAAAAAACVLVIRTMQCNLTVAASSIKQIKIQVQH